VNARCALALRLTAAEKRALLHFAETGRGFDDYGIYRSAPLRAALDKLHATLARASSAGPTPHTTKGAKA
jgi:hypothetical protein